MSLASVAFKKMFSLWSRRDRVGLKRRIRLYEACVLPVLMYNASTWGLPKSAEEKIDAFHRRQLRCIVGIKYPARVKNASLYKMTRPRPVGDRIRHARMRMFGHALRMNSQTPAQLAMDHYFTNGRRRRGRPQPTLPSRLDADMQKAGLSFKSQRDLASLRTVASDRERWQEVIKKSC